jgi:hypothetical protein
MRFFYRTCVVFLLALPVLGSAIDLQPNDLVAPSPDKTFLMLSYFSTQNTSYYRNGTVVSSAPYSNPIIDSPNMIIRASRSYAIGELPGLTFIQVPYGTIQPAGSINSFPSSNGLGDLTVATALWPYANRDTRTYVGMAGFLTLPTGSYANSQSLNMGENRYKTALQIGLQTPIIGNLDGMLAIDTMWYGGNNQCATACGSASNVPLNQKPLTTSQLGAVYKINQTYTLGASYFNVTGGATSINNRYQDNVINTQRFMLTAQAYTDVGRFSVQYGQDLAIENGFIQTRLLAVRYTKSF